MTSEKDIYLTGYSYKLGTEEAEKAWKTKCIFMVKKWPEHSLIEMYRSYLTDSDIPQSIDGAPMVINDLAPYKSMIDGSMITSRSQHRNHLKQHNCIEVGNETKHLKPAKVAPPPGLKQELINQVNAKLRY